MNPLYLLACGLPIVSAAEVRPLSTDRPDTTESPFTVDAGHFQFEMEIANASRDQFSLAELNSKIGLDVSTDLQLVTPFYTRTRHDGEGSGDVEIRLKRNLWGNDSGTTALALMPFIKIPTAHGDLGNDEFEGGLIVPFGFDGPSGWSCAVMAELDLAADDDGGNHHFTGIASATASHEVTEHTAVFLELVSVASAESRSAYEAYFNTGMTWAITSACQLDGGVRLGLTDAATDFTPFLGASTKF